MIKRRDDDRAAIIMGKLPRNDKNHKNKELRSSHENLRDDQSPWIYLKVQLNKGPRGYGIAFIYDRDPYRKDDTISITKIVNGSVADQDGRLRVHDVIVSVNNLAFDDVSYDNAIETLRNIGPNMVLVVRRLRDDYYESDENHDDTDHFDLATPSAPTLDYSYEDSNFEQFQVRLTKGSTGGLGIHINGGYDDDNEDEDDSNISILKLAPNGVAHLSGKLKVGDIILKVDDTSLDGVTHQEAVEIMRNTGRTVTLDIGRFVKKKKMIVNNMRY